MGRWGEGLFEGDADLDEASEISDDAGMELFHYEIETNPDDDMGGKGLEATREHLNNGVLQKLFETYLAKDKKLFFWGRELRLVFTAALAMRVGATIPPKYMDLLQSTYTKIQVAPKYAWPLADTGFRAPGKKQFEIALAHYKNDGTPYDFYADRCLGAGCDKAEDELEDGKKLMKCAKCKEASYCSRDCQVKDWQMHKKTCLTPAQRTEREERASSGQGFMSLNV